LVEANKVKSISLDAKHKREEIQKKTKKAIRRLLTNGL